MKPSVQQKESHWPNLEEIKQLKQKLGCSRRKDDEGVQLDKNTQMGEDRVGGPFCFWECFSVYTLFHLYHVTVWCLCRAQRGLTKRVKHGERERPSREWSQKIYFSPVQKPVLQARTIQPVEKETERDRQGQVGRECWRIDDTVRRNI